LVQSLSRRVNLGIVIDVQLHAVAERRRFKRISLNREWANGADELGTKELPPIGFRANSLHGKYLENRKSKERNSETRQKSALTYDAQRRLLSLPASTAHHETAARIGREIAIVVGFVLSQPAVAAPPDRPDPALVPWFESLKQPGTGASCCSIADCRTVESRQDRDGYEVLIDGRWKMSVPFWLRVPPNRIINRIDNPTNRGVVCFTPEAGILCFVRPADS
jgi:hypothetical protein